MAGRIFMLFICVLCVATIESDVGSLENFNRLLLQYRKRLLEMRYNPLFRDNVYSSLRNASNIQPIRALINKKDSLAKSDSMESNNDTIYHLETSGEYIPTGNPVIDDVSQSTQDNSTDFKTSQTASEESLFTGSSPADNTTGPPNPSTKQQDLSKNTPVSPTDAVTLSKEDKPSSVVLDSSTDTSATTKNLPSTTSSSNEISDISATSLSSESTETANATDLSTKPEDDNASSYSTDISETTTEKTNITVVTTSTEISKDNLSTTNESEIADKTELTTISVESSPPTSSEKSTDITSRDTTINMVSSTTSTNQESSSVEPTKITVTDNQPQSSMKVTGITNAVTTTVFPSSSTNEEVTDTTVTNEPRHIIAIYNPTVTTVKLALSIVFMIAAFLGFVVLVAYMVKRQRQSIPYEELSLEP